MNPQQVSVEVNARTVVKVLSIVLAAFALIEVLNAARDVLILLGISLFLAVALLVGWVRSDASEARRLDRQADRDDDAALRRYNRQLADLGRKDEQL